MKTITVAAFERVHAVWQMLIDESIERFGHFPSVPYLAPILSGESVVVWNHLDRQVGTDNRAASYLMLALVAQANRWERDGLDRSAADARWLVQRIADNVMTVVGAHHLD